MTSSILNNIKNIINIDSIELYRNFKLILKGNNINDIKDQIKNNFDTPSKNIGVFILFYKFNPNGKHPLIINCSQYTITPELNLVFEKYDKSQKILYTINDLETFKILHLKKIMYVIKNRLIHSTKVILK